MSKLFNIIGITLSGLGLIGGIIYGLNTKDFSLSLYIWIGTFLYCIIYFGIARILSNQDMIMSANQRHYNEILKKLQEIPNHQNNLNDNLEQQNTPKENVSPKSSIKHFFRCPNCGKMIEAYPCMYCQRKI